MLDPPFVSAFHFDSVQHDCTVFRNEVRSMQELVRYCLSFHCHTLVFLPTLLRHNTSRNILVLPSYLLLDLSLVLIPPCLSPLSISHIFVHSVSDFEKPLDKLETLELEPLLTLKLSAR